MSRAGTSLCIQGFGRIVNILVAFVAAFWFVLKALIELTPSLIFYDAIVTILFTGFLILISAKVMEEKSKLYSIFMIALGVILHGVVIFYGLSSTSILSVAVLEPFFVAIYIYWSIILGYNIAKSSGITESSPPMDRLLPLILVILGAGGFYIGLPYLVSQFFVPGSPLFTVPIAGLLTSLILVGASMMSLRSHAVYWFLFFVGLGITVAPFLLPAFVLTSYYEQIFFVGHIMFKFFGVVAVAYVNPPPEYSGLQ